MEGIRRTDGHILRRYTRLSLDFNSMYDPLKATPEENTFEFRRGNGATIGRIVFKEFDPHRAVGETPWGSMSISKSSFMGPYEIGLGAVSVATFSVNLSQTKVNVSFAKGERIRFSSKLVTMDLSGETDRGKVEVQWEGEYGPADVKQDGLILRKDMPKELSDRVDEARANYKARKKSKMLQPNEPKSIEMPYYVQWRIILPRDFEQRDDILSALAFITAYRCLRAEMLQKL